MAYLGSGNCGFTVDDVPNIQRTIVIFPIIELIAAYGFVIFTNRFKDFKYKAVVAFSAFFLIMNFFISSINIFVHSPIHRNWYRNEGFGQMVDLVKKDYSSYDNIIVTKSLGGVYPLILFYMKYDPSQYQKEGSSKDINNTGFGKFFLYLLPVRQLIEIQVFQKQKKQFMLIMEAVLTTKV